MNMQEAKNSPKDKSITILTTADGWRRIIAIEGNLVLVDCILAPGMTFGNDTLIKRWPGEKIEHQRKQVETIAHLRNFGITRVNPLLTNPQNGQGGEILELSGQQ